MPPCAKPKPFHPAAALLCAVMFCSGTVALTAGLLSPDQPLPPIRTSPDQTPVAWTPRPTSTAELGFVSVATPRSTFFVGVQSYALLSHCGVYGPTLPAQQMPTNRVVAMQPVPGCRSG